MRKRKKTFDALEFMRKRRDELGKELLSDPEKFLADLEDARKEMEKLKSRKKAA